jgi:hypothetical protein
MLKRQGCGLGNQQLWCNAARNRDNDDRSFMYINRLLYRRIADEYNLDCDSIHSGRSDRVLDLVPSVTGL